ncbi:NAD(P)-dependent dehydrogenase (short-subunit alcohol dehydrogenase family) [Chitinophaga terrae (ex Kim and Jung 2007)]|uniref:SDR family oxidoreductase n=1 Tax=Chitinophaga terrae (ex Kim and Jung 2007) TaxID=408074 RepID=UPI0027858A07|nr:SDR family oxidoreductase [Chitinophaga terrae (ex Kim and Jung 2007)]MDQ0108684.1 NAD(P)-dependent dehydrogenase (short-subunit alcohol dehydrogenase family) [Chitinophaga terrae (ex Kim and Jung 2007)]
MKANFEGEKVIVAGGSTGVGLATAKQFHEAKAQVIITGRSEQRLREAQTLLPGVQTEALDSTNRPALDTFFKQQGNIDHLVISLSGGKGMGELADLPVEDLRSGFEGKFWPILNTLQAALPYLNKTGSITIVTAASSVLGAPGTSGLAAINGSLELMLPAIAKEIQPLRINAVSPGVVDTSWWDFLPADEKQAAFAKYAAVTPVGRVGQAAEIADGIFFLAGNGFINGTVLRIDGGLSL